MFEKEKRFSFKQGLPKKVISTPYFSLRFGDRKNDTGTNAVVVSKKVSKKAVVRNKVKRKVVAIMKSKLGEKLELYDVVIYMRPLAETVDDEILEKALIDSIEKI